MSGSRFITPVSWCTTSILHSWYILVGLALAHYHKLCQRTSSSMLSGTVDVKPLWKASCLALSLDRQIYETYKASYFHIRALRHIRFPLTVEACKTIAAAIEGSWLDYCNSLLAGASCSNMARLEHFQNTLSRVALPINLVLPHHVRSFYLHWLPVCLNTYHVQKCVCVA